MSIEVHIRVKESDWKSESDLAFFIAHEIENSIPKNINIQILVFPVEDKENKMQLLHKLGD